MPQQDLVDSYLPSFQTCVEEGKASGLMVSAGRGRAPRHRRGATLTPPPPPTTTQCSYNAVNGVPSCANDWLLKDVLRDSWQFDGCVEGNACVPASAPPSPPPPPPPPSSL